MLLALSVAYGLALFAVSATALWKRARALLAACAVVALGWLASILLIVPDAGWSHLQIGILTADAAVLLGLSAISIVSKRKWAVMAAAVQLATVAIHLAFWANPGIWFPAYAGALQLFGWLVLAIFAAAAGLEPWVRHSTPSTGTPG